MWFVPTKDAYIACTFLYSVTLTEYEYMLQSKPRVCVCVSVCVCVCLSVSALQPRRLCQFWWNFVQMISQMFASDIFRSFWNFEFDDVMAAILHFCVPALSRSQFLFDFLQIWIQVTKLLSTVCYWKSAKSVDKFRRYNGPRFQKISKMAAKK